MEKVKIYEIAKKFNLSSKEVLEKALQLNINVKSHLSSIEEDDAKRLEETLNSKADKKEVVKSKDTGIKKDTKNETPVIIRREVIITEEETKKKEEQKRREEKRQSSVGFIERKQNDYNIVYRNKPSKPMTVNELFGIKKDNKDEEKAKEVSEASSKTKTSLEYTNNEIVEEKQKNKVETQRDDKINNFNRNNYNQNRDIQFNNRNRQEMPNNSHRNGQNRDNVGFKNNQNNRDNQGFKNNNYRNRSK